jgi:hypothetical protein
MYSNAHYVSLLIFHRITWQALGAMSQEEAKLCFAKLLDELCPLFSSYIEAHKRDVAEKDRVM